MRDKFYLIAAAFVLSSTAVCSSSALADDAPLKVCAASNELPYSNEKGEGFENKIAELLGTELKRKVEAVYWKDPRYFIRDFLDKGLCDVVIGVDAGDPRVLTTKPYYRSGYVFISRTADNLDLQNWDSAVLKKAQKIAFVPATPAEVMLRAIGRYNELFNYQQELVGYKSKRNEYVKYDMPKLVSEVSSGRAELAVLWSPAAARYVKASSVPLTATLIPDNNKRADGEKVGFHFSTAMAVRKGNDELLAQLNHVIADKQSAINEILSAEGMVLVTD
jgi:mxaJ protein